MSRTQQLTARLKQKAQELGFTTVGVVAAQPSPRLDAYLGWIEAGMHGRMGYMARSDRIARRRDLNVILPGVRSIVCVGLDYYSMRLPPELVNDPSRGRISNYAWGADYHDVMTPRLRRLSQWLAAASAGDIKTKVYVDTGAILERSHAAAAGLGFEGKNTMLIAPRSGSYFFLGELLTDIDLTPDTPRQLPDCGSCTRCLVACPTDAFPQPYVLDARRCISYLTIELKDAIPLELRPLIGNWIYGCDICQDVCPFNRFAVDAAPPPLRPQALDNALPPLIDILQLNQAQFDSRFGGTPIGRIKRRRLLRNACVAAGNWGDSAAVPLLAQLLTDDESLIRSHAAWALGQIGSAVAKAEIAARLTEEVDGAVRAELQRAAR